MGIKETTVTIVVVNVDIVTEGYPFISQFGVNSRFCVHLCHEMNICVVGVVVHKDSGTKIPLSGRATVVNGNEAFGGTSQLFNADNSTGSEGLT